MAWKQLRDMLEDILVKARSLRQESCRCGEGRGREEVAESESGREGSRYSGTDTGYDWLG